jgi:hypothetical protein
MANYKHKGFIVEVRRYAPHDPPATRYQKLYPNTDRICAGFLSYDIKEAWIFSKRTEAAKFAEQLTNNNPGYPGDSQRHKVEPCDDRGIVHYVVMYFNAENACVEVAFLDEEST